MRRLDMYYLHRRNLLAPGSVFTMSWSRNGERFATIGIRAESGRIILKYRISQRGGEWEDREYPVALDWTACHYGGQRPWFLCPCCWRRVGVLYGGAVFACRHCHNLAYDCQREELHSRLQSQELKLRDRLGWKSSKYGSKPKGMHWKTFERLEEEHALFNAALWGAIAEKFKLGV
jgi:hypothetical protein